jgi:hypothetical protein
VKRLVLATLLACGTPYTQAPDGGDTEITVPPPPYSQDPEDMQPIRTPCGARRSTFLGHDMPELCRPYDRIRDLPRPVDNAHAAPHAMP